MKVGFWRDSDCREAILGKTSLRGNSTFGQVMRARVALPEGAMELPVLRS